MIKSIKHKSLKNYWLTGSLKGLNAEWIPRLKRMIAALEAASKPDDLALPSYNFHELKGDMKGYYSIKLTGNYRVIFKFEEDSFTLVDIVDYH